VADDATEQRARTSPGRRLRRLISADEILLLPGVYDGFSVRLVESLGYTAAFITGSGVSESRYGLPDVGVMGLAENLDCARMLVARSNLALLADADTGYGNPVNVHYAVRAFEQAGVAGVMLEDQTWPKRCGHMAGKELIAAEDMAMKVRAACDARQDPATVIGARTDAAGPAGLDEAIRRARMYRDAGADLLFADALLSEDDIARFAAEASGPVLVNMGFGIRRRATTPLLSAARLREMGVAAVIYPRLLTAAAITGMRRAMAALAESAHGDHVTEHPDLTVSFEELNRLVGFDEITELEGRYLTEDERSRKYRTASS
jgi:2-methylisocitrate lyase-like PEP mutase family enzyme